MIYFLRSGDLIKIGSCKKFEARWVSLRRDLPFPSDVELLGTEDGWLHYEQHLQRNVFWKRRAFSEWFHACPEILEHVASQCIKPTERQEWLIRNFAEKHSQFYRGWTVEERKAKKAEWDAMTKVVRERVAARKAREREERYTNLGQLTKQS